MFVAFGEVHEKILAGAAARLSLLEVEVTVESIDVLRWTIDETRHAMKDSIPLWANQGLAYQFRHQAWNSYIMTGNRGALINGLLEQESQTLEELYGYSTNSGGLGALQRTPGGLSQHINPDIRAIWEHYKKFGLDTAAMGSVRLQEEQEREIALEIEHERQIERPPAMKEALHFVSPATLHFVRHGILPPSCNQYVAPALNGLCTTSLHQKVRQSVGWSVHLAASADFVTTVAADARTVVLDQFLRPVTWILRSRKSPAWLIISPHEANEVYHLVKNSNQVSLHIYAPRTRRSQRHFEDFRYCVVGAGSELPPNYIRHPSDVETLRQLNLFAGQLVFRSSAEYRAVADFLGLYIGKRAICDRNGDATIGDDNGMLISPGTGEPIKLGPAGFVSPESRAALGMTSGDLGNGRWRFRNSPVGMLVDLLEMRGKGLPFGDSMVGGMLDGRLVRDEEFEDGMGQEEAVGEREEDWEEYAMEDDDIPYPSQEIKEEVVEDGDDVEMQEVDDEEEDDDIMDELENEELPIDGYIYSGMDFDFDSDADEDMEF